MTRTPSILGPAYDAHADLAAALYLDGPKRAAALAELKPAEAASDEETARLMWWELGMIDLMPVTADGVSPWRASEYECAFGVLELEREPVDPRL